MKFLPQLSRLPGKIGIFRGMKSISFRPLRLNKRTGKIIVASYRQWGSVKTADYNKFELLVIDDYRTMPDDALVYNHKGENLFFYTYNPAEVPVYSHPKNGRRQYGINWGDSISYNCCGMDCSGVPTFSFYTSEKIAQFYSSTLHDFEPLTVGMVKMWLGWFLYQLENNTLKIGK